MYSKLIEHSVYKDKELITLEVRSPKFLDSEYEKHCAIASNSSSDRAIPFVKMLEQKPYIPKDIRLNEKGMQGSEQIDKQLYKDFTWDLSEMYEGITRMLKLYPEIHKQHLNRYILPFSMQTKVMTASRDDWEYFFNLRDHKDADPNIQESAKLIRMVVDGANNPRELRLGEWHMPYVTAIEKLNYCTEELLKMSAARCARTSGLTHDKKPSTFLADTKLFDDTLMGGDIPHLSPLDHQGMAIDDLKLATIINVSAIWPKGVTHLTRDWQWGSGKMKGWVCFRHWYLQS